MDFDEDALKLQRHHGVNAMLIKEGEPGEQVHFSDFVLKINRRDKEQNRVLLITDKGLYNLDAKTFGKCKRRIALSSIEGLTLSSVAGSEEFVVHVPDEYDYRFKSAKKEKVAFMIQSLRLKLDGSKIAIAKRDQKTLKNVTVTRIQAKLESRESRIRRYREAIAAAHDSDQEDTAAHETGGDTRQLLPNTEKVGLEHFDFLKVIGRGSFGKVMQVRKKDSGKIYAMKILKKSAIVARHQVEHTKAERKILEALQHPFLMGLRFAFQTKGKLYFVLDYYRGGELFFHLKQKRRFTEDEARLFVAEVGLALGHLHSLDVIYRDLKPENILLDHTGHLCLTDFGLSKDLNPDNPEAHTFCGTPEYLAPEIVMGTGHGKAVDWWSLGILLYELTVGIPPFYSQNVNEMYHKIQHGVLRFPPFLSEECKSLIIGLLNRDPEERLGAGTQDFTSIKVHPFFASLDFEKLMRKEIDPPYKPSVKALAEDSTEMFEAQFTTEMVQDTPVEASELANVGEDQFAQWTFKDGGGHLG